MSNKLNGYDLSRSYWDFAFEHPDKVKPYHAAIYFFSIEHCNRLGWKSKFGFPTSMVMEATGMKSYGSYKKYFDDLVKWGFFKVIQYSKNQFSSNIIALTSNIKAQGKALDKALIKHGAKQDESIDSIDKQETINHETNNKEPKVYSKEVHACFDTCAKKFPDHLKPNNEKIKNNWLDVIDKLNRIDKIPFNHIEKITNWARDDSFWSAHFLSLPKLRKANNDGIKYVVVFNEKLNNNGGKPTITDDDIIEAVRARSGNNNQ